MCIFTSPVRDVSNTKIFARITGRGTQFLVYQMTYGADKDLAMVLPLPVSSHTEDAVRFIALDQYPNFFDDLEQAFTPQERSHGSLGVACAGTGVLAVHQVGKFEASFVPTLEGFDRLDERFRLPRQVWDQLPVYADCGFAVFKLRNAGEELADVHPMAFEFPTALKNTLYFPTVHIHDKKVHPEEQFDHALYWQGGATRRLTGFRKSFGDLGVYVRAEKTHGVVAGRMKGYKLSLHGIRPNIDVLLPLVRE